VARARRRHRLRETQAPPIAELELHLVGIERGSDALAAFAIERRPRDRRLRASLLYAKHEDAESGKSWQMTGRDHGIPAIIVTAVELYPSSSLPRKERDPRRY